MKSNRRLRRRFLPAFLASVVIGAANFAPEVRAATPPVDSFVRISDDEGLAHSDVRAIAQDHEGFIWLGLRLAGLTRYDGYELKVHQHDPTNSKTIGSRVIWSLLVDKRGTLWVGTEGGLDRYDRKTDTFIHYRHNEMRPDSLSHNTVVCLAEDSSGHIWAGTRDGLCRLDDPERGTFTIFRRPQPFDGSTTKDTYRSIIEDPATGLLWLGSNEGAAAFDPRTGAFATFIHDPQDPESLSRNAVNKVIRDETGVFWALTEFGLNSFEPSFTKVEKHSVQTPRLAFKRFIQPSGAGNSGINFVRDGLVDRKHRLWLATRGGLQLLDRSTGTFTSYQRRAADRTSMSDDLTQAVFEDRAGSIWVGTYAGGASRLRSEAKPFTVHRHLADDPATVSDDRIAGLAFDTAGRLWAATVNGLNCYDGKKWKRFLHESSDPYSIPNNDLSTVAAAPDGSVWVGTGYMGVARYDQKRFQPFPTSPANAPAPNGWHPFTGVQVNSIFADSRGGVWIGARAYGLDYFWDGRFRHYNPQEAVGEAPAQPTVNTVLAIETPDGGLWFATETSGLMHFDYRTERFTAYRPPIATPGTTRSVHCIADGGDGSIWLGAADGLLKFDIKTTRFVREYTTVDGLPHAAVMTIVPDLRGHLWLGTANGLADFNPATEKFRVYEKPDGLPTNVFSQRTGVLGQDGRIHLGTRAGLLSFAPDELRDNPNPPVVAITELQWLGTPPPAPTGSNPGSVLNVGESIRVPAGQLGFILRFAALDFSAPEKNHYRYRLHGWENAWRSATARERSATYTSLPPGNYVFQVQASNADNVWNEIGRSVQIVVEPKVWQTVWFRLGTGLAILAIGGASLHWRLRTIRRRNALLEQQVSQRTGELQQEVSVRQKAEAALRESHKDLERRVQLRTAELAQTNSSLQAEIVERKSIEAQLRQSQKMEAIGQLAGGVAHDFNNLLTVILGQSELLGDTGMRPEEREASVRDIKSAAQRATNLTRQLLVFSRHQAMNPEEVDLNRVVSGVSKLLRHVIGEQIAFETQLRPGPLGVLADPGMLEQVLLNMAVNARDAMNRGGRLTIATTHVTVSSDQARRASPHATPGHYARFSVSDTGAGIPEKILPLIFEPFFTTKESGKGTGLGLAISLGIVQQHRGWIDVETRPAQGTTFHVYLPSYSMSPEVAAPKTVIRTHATGDTTILVAEDESAVRSLVQHVLMRQGYRVIEASSGGDALTQWAMHRDEITILLTDIVMPGWPDGHELAAKLAGEKPSLRIVTMSGYDPGEIVNRGGLVRPHLRKPFTADDLLNAIDSTVQK
ncbi:MAG TPA: two-component regulator propeller domain-containing protein [Opitutaceae bacterium]|nr:two-component regulator propeller domain-containing protein [Opitutaceae bacterium]